MVVTLWVLALVGVTNAVILPCWVIPILLPIRLMVAGVRFNSQEPIRAEDFLVRYLVYPVPRLGLNDDILVIGVSNEAKFYRIYRRWWDVQLMESVGWRVILRGGIIISDNIQTHLLVRGKTIKGNMWKRIRELEECGVFSSIVSKASDKNEVY